MLTWQANPATSASVTWRTDDSVQAAVGEIVIAPDGPKFESVARADAETSPFTSDLGISHRHSVHFQNLKPATKYAYRVGDGANWSEWCQFRTASAQEKPFRFVYFGDAQNSVLSMWSRVVRQAYADAADADFLLHAGDLINSANADGEWGEWFYAGGFIHRSTPCVATPGNHEYARSGILGRKLSDQWRPTFAFPTNGPPGLEETCYWFDYQGTRFVSLNSNEQIEEQADWLRGVLKDNSARWTIVTHHHPLFSAAKRRDNPGLRAAWQPLFDEFGVDLVLQGHDHTYARSGMMQAESNEGTGVSSQPSKGGTVYVVSVSGPKMYELEKRPFMQRTAEKTQLYQVISVDGDRLKYEAHTATGKLYDAFVLTRQADGHNQLTETLPPEQ